MTKTHFRWAAMTALALLGGCTVGPDFKRPAAPGQNAYIPATEKPGAAATAGEGQLRWWSAFGSPEIDTLVDRALANNHSLAASNATLGKAREQLAAVRGTRLPQVEANARIDQQQVNFAAYGFPGDNPEFHLYSVGGIASFDLDLFGRRRRQVEQAAADLEAQLHQTQAAHLSIAGQVVTQVVAIAAINSRIATAQTLIEDDQRNVDLTEKRRKGGEGTLVEVLNAQSQLADDRTLLSPLYQQRSVAAHLLAILVGAAPSDFTAPDLDLSKLTLPASIPVSLPSELVHRRPDILQAEANLHSATAAIGVATARLYPDITLGATLSQGTPALSNLLKNGFRGYDIFAGVTAPVFNGGTYKAQQRAAIEEAKAADALYQQTVLTAFQQVADLLTGLEHDRAAVASNREAIEIAGRAVKLSRRSFEVGNSGVLQILDAQRVYQRALSAIVEANARQYFDSVQLFVATAGGWTGKATDGQGQP
jgi:NodT family efflux transporter outer membrane factor (OMF) lipoprotein